MTALTPTGLPPVATYDELAALWFAGKAPGTRRGYRHDVAKLGEFLGTADAADTARTLLGDHGEANRLVLAWRGAMVDGGLSPATINRRLAAVRSLVKLARMIGRVTWAIDVPGVKSKAFRDTRGVGWGVYQEALKRATVRDRCVLELLGGRGLRRGELVSLDVGHFVEDFTAVWVLGKGRRERELLTLSDETAAAVRAWVAERGEHSGALFPGRSRGSRLGVTQVWRVCKRYGVRPHGLRHTFGTRVAEVTNGNMLAVRATLRHGSVATSQVYVDNQADLAGEVVRQIRGGE